jgi:hypothetical protein
MGARDLDYDDVLRNLRLPLLVSHGRSDSVVLPAMAQHVLNVCPTAEASWYDGGGHVPFLESPDRFNRELEALDIFLSDVPELLAPGGVLFTSSCSYHVSRDIFQAMLADAARDSGRRIQFLGATGAADDHPELLNVPETGYLKGFLLRALP